MDYIITRSDGSEALYHHGIKGQKWGIRKYQNEDGTLTEAGKKKYGKKIYKKHLDEATELRSEHYKSYKKNDKELNKLEKERKDYMKKNKISQDDPEDRMDISWKNNSTIMSNREVSMLENYLNMVDKIESREQVLYQKAGEKAYYDLFNKYYAKH